MEPHLSSVKWDVYVLFPVLSWDALCVFVLSMLSAFLSGLWVPGVSAGCVLCQTRGHLHSRLRGTLGGWECEGARGDICVRHSRVRAERCGGLPSQPSAAQRSSGQLVLCLPELTGLAPACLSPPTLQRRAEDKHTGKQRTHTCVYFSNSFTGLIVQFFISNRISCSNRRGAKVEKKNQVRETM